MNVNIMTGHHLVQVCYKPRLSPMLSGLSVKPGNFFLIVKNTV